MIRTVQAAFAQTSAPADALGLPLPRPSAVGSTLSVYLRFSPLTGTPAVSDSFGNAYRLTGSAAVGPGLAVAFFAADVVRGGAGHTITAAAQGGPQNLEMGASELSLVGPVAGERASAADLLLALLAQANQTNALLQRLVTAERA